MNLISNVLKIEPSVLRKDFSNFQCIQQYLFDPSAMNLTAGDFYRLVEVPCTIYENYDLPFDRKTYYENAKKINKQYGFYLFPDYIHKQSLTTYFFYRRLHNWLIPRAVFDPTESNESSAAETEDLLSAKLERYLPANLKVTKEFFPLYIGLICCASKTNNWPSVCIEALRIAEHICRITPEFWSSRISIDQMTLLYKHWLQLMLPEKLYYLLNEIDTFIKKQSNHPLFRSAANLNLNIFAGAVADTLFVTPSVQDKFLAETHTLFTQQKSTASLEDISSPKCNFEENDIDADLSEEERKLKQKLEAATQQQKMLMHSINKHVITISPEKIPFDYIQKERDLYQDYLKQSKQENKEVPS